MAKQETVEYSSYALKVFNRIKEINEISFSVDDYDAILVMKIADSNRIKKKSTGHQSHIAITGEKRDMFPFIDIAHYSQEKLDSNYKSYYVLQVPFTIYKKNLEYAINGTNDIDFVTNTLTVNVSSKLSRRQNQEAQIELGNTTQSDEPFKKFREIFSLIDDSDNNALVILKRRGKLEYDSLVLKGNDLEDIDYCYACMPKKVTTVVKVDEFEQKQQKYRGENVIFYGAPGTGKSHDLAAYINENTEEYDVYSNDNLEEKGNVFRITLYPEYEYSDFVGQLLPTRDATFEYKEGIFVQALLYAQSHAEEPVFMILEEMSRANVAAVFGDLFQLLDRKADGSSEYAINNLMIGEMLGGSDRITLPSNLFILGTVNTSDQNVFVMDTAFKRRFIWKYKSTNIDEDDLKSAGNNPDLDINLGESTKITWYQFYTKLNEFITEDLGLSEDKQIGPFFINFDGEESTHELLRDKLLQYLWEDVHQVAVNSYNTNKRIFKPSLGSFSKLYTNFDEENENVFSDELTKKLTEVKSDGSTED